LAVSPQCGFASIAAAHRELEGRRTSGKVLLEMG